MNAIGRYFLELLGTLLVVGLLNFVVVGFLRKKLRPLPAALFAFVINGFLVFCFAPFLLKTKNPEAVYLPVLLLYLLIDVIWANKLKK